MKLFLSKIFAFALPLACLGILADYMASEGLRKTRFRNYAVWNDVRNGHVNANLIVNGNSRAWVHISPRILDSALSLNTYNLGINGYNFQMQQCLFNLYCAHNRKPHTVIQCVDASTLQKDGKLIEYEQFLPYLSEPSLRACTEKYEGLTFSDYHIPLLRYYSTKEFLIGVAEFLHLVKLAPDRYKGFQAKDKAWDRSFEIAVARNPQGDRADLDEEQLELFRDYLSHCAKNNIQVILVWVPQYIEGQRYITNMDSVVLLFKGLSDKYKIPFLDYSKDSLSYHKELFYNSQHLNAKGARLFSRKLAGDLKIHSQIRNE